MSSYWKGYSGIGLALSAEEFDTFFREYATQNLDGCYLDPEVEDVSEFTFLSKQNEKFYFTQISEDHCEGAGLLPLKVNGRCNNTSPYDYYRDLYKNSYVTWVKHDPSMPANIDCPKYRNVDGIIEEFKSCMAQYLPEDFDWEAHIGLIDYACYA